jgi:lipopolysaccharide/colanic/teichoic acid biosynthesis glycosyltransferase
MAKRLLDFSAALLGLLLLAPAFGLIAAAIKLESRGPVFFRQERVGRHGRPFRIFKFRTMAAGTVAAAGPQITVAGDTRVTRVGAWLRRFKLDELAQLIDVLRGTMSLVGPRPEVPRFVEHYPPEWRERLLSVRPGITDFASVRFRDEGELLAGSVDPEREYIEVVLPAKLQYALDYVDNPTLGTDLRVLGLTLRTVFVPALPTPRSLFAMNDSRLWVRLDQAMSAVHPRNRTVATIADAITILACWQATYLFRLGFERWQPERPPYDSYVSFGVVAVYLVSLAVTGVPRGLWRFFGFDDFRRIAAACVMAGLFSAVAILMGQLTAVPRAVLVLHPLFCIAVLSLTRMLYRLTAEHARSRVDGTEGEPRRAIVLGAGEAGRRLVAGIHRRDGWTVLALLDDDPAKRGLRIGGVTVTGALPDVLKPHVLAGATHIIVAMPGVSPERRDQAIELARQSRLPVLTVPSKSELHAQPVGIDGSPMTPASP